MEQLGMFKDTVTNGKRDLKAIDYSAPIGMYKELKDVKGVSELSENSLALLHYLYMHHAREEDGFIHAKELAFKMGYMDTREIRKCCAEIDFKTELVVYASQYGYKLVSSQREMLEAIKFALAPAMTSIRRVFGKNKQSTLNWLHGFIGNLEKEFGGITQGQQQVDDDMSLREVNHFPKQPFRDSVLPVSERLDEYLKKGE